MNERFKETSNKLVLIVEWKLKKRGSSLKPLVHFSSILQYLQKGLQFQFVGPSHIVADAIGFSSYQWEKQDKKINVTLSQNYEQ